MCVVHIQQTRERTRANANVRTIAGVRVTRAPHVVSAVQEHPAGRDGHGLHPDRKCRERTYIHTYTLTDMWEKHVVSSPHIITIRWTSTPEVVNSNESRLSWPRVVLTGSRATRGRRRRSWLVVHGASPDHNVDITIKVDRQCGTAQCQCNRAEGEQTAHKSMQS